MGHQADVDCVVWHPNGNLVASGSTDRSARLWDLRSGKCARLLPNHAQGVSCLAVSPDGSMLVSGTLDGGVRMWDIGKAEPLSAFQAHEGSTLSVACSRAGQLVASGGADCCLCLWHPARCALTSGRHEVKPACFLACGIHRPDAHT